MTAPAQRLLSTLIAPWADVEPALDRPIVDLTLDSRTVVPGALFAALAGTRGHGLAYVEQVLQKEAAAILWQPSADVDAAAAQSLCAARGVPCIAVPDLAMRLSAIAGRFFGQPSRLLRLIGVTGTDGKTSVSQFLARALSDDDLPCGVIGTLGYGIPGALVEPTHTTPDAIQVQRLLADMRTLGARDVAMEVSSHALAQGRVEDLQFDVAVLTNLTRDHLDYHGTEEAYAAAKARLFAMPGLKAAVLNADDDFGRRLARSLAADVERWTYSLDPRARAQVVCRELRFHPQGLVMAFATPYGQLPLALPLVGRFNAANVAATLTALLAMGMPLAECGARLLHLQPVRGRMECLGGGAHPLVVVDYAHTPAALAAALDAVRAHVPGQVWCVFGCGGDRDRGKRPVMGGVADQKADELVITDDNPRSEDPQAIVEEILTGVSTHEPFVVRDRAAAIRLAVSCARPGDAVLVAGKGHETYQIMGRDRLAFDDRAVALSALEERAP